LVDVDSRTPLPLALSPRQFLLALSSSKRPEQIGKVGYSRLNTSFVAVKLIDIVAVLIGFCGLRDFDPSIGQRKHVYRLISRFHNVTSKEKAHDRL